MSGVTKRKYESELIKVTVSLKKPIYSLVWVLPVNYTLSDIINKFKEYYPYEYKNIDEMLSQYKEKNDFLISHKKKFRYTCTNIKQFFQSIMVVKNLLNVNKIVEHNSLLGGEEYIANQNKFIEERFAKIQKRAEKIINQTKNIQQIEPAYFKIYEIYYHKKGITINDKIEIVNELAKFDSKDVIVFFQKLNESERNDQVRQVAFDYLQKNNHYVRLRKNFKGKKKSYTTETFNFDMTPKDLYNKLKYNTMQNVKNYDYFISHSYLDSKYVTKLIEILNGKGFHCYCDWTSDKDFLKRSLVSDYTKEVLKFRIEQSKEIILLESENINNSEWVTFEIDYATLLNKKIYYTKISELDSLDNIIGNLSL